MTVHNHIFDEIKATLGNIHADEYEQRRRLRDCRAWASSLIHKPAGVNARSLLWMVCDCATNFYLSAHDTETLEKAALFCRDLIVLAEKAADLEVADGLA